MKEFVNKLIEPLKKEYATWRKIDKKAKYEGMSNDYARGICAGLLYAIKTQTDIYLAEEYRVFGNTEQVNNDFCEWERSPSNKEIIKPYHHKGSVGMYAGYLNKYPYCPQCGKKIKVIGE